MIDFVDLVDFSLTEAKAFGLPGNVGSKAHLAFMTGHAAAVNGEEQHVPKWAKSKACTKAYKSGYARGLKSKKEATTDSKGKTIKVGDYVKWSKLKDKKQEPKVVAVDNDSVTIMAVTGRGAGSRDRFKIPKKDFNTLTVVEQSDKDHAFKVKCPSCGKEMNSPKGSYVPTDGTKCPSCGHKMKKKENCVDDFKVDFSDLASIIDGLIDKEDDISDLVDSYINEDPVIEQDVDVNKLIKDLGDTDWGKDNDAQMKAVQLLKGLALSEDPKSNEFMKALSDASTKIANEIVGNESVDEASGDKVAKDLQRKTEDCMVELRGVKKQADRDLKDRDISRSLDKAVEATVNAASALADYKG
jgi:hypothetical protein